MNFLLVCVLALQAALFILIIAPVWRRLDMRFILRSNQHKAQLQIEGRWKELEEYFETAPKTWRPFVWLHYRYRIPGNVTVQHALFLRNLGRLEEALAKIDIAIQQINGKSPIFWFIRPHGTGKTLSEAFRTRALILTNLGRHDQAREAAEQLKELTGRPEITLALLDFNCGQLDEALAEAEAIPQENGQYDTARLIVAHVHEMKGEFYRAIQSMSEEPGDVTKYYTPAGLKTMRASAEGAKLLELRQKKHSGVVQPIRFLRIAESYLQLEDFKNVDLNLDHAENLLGSEPGVQGAYCRLRACSFAGQGESTEAKSYIDRLRMIIAERNRRSLVHESHRGIGRAYLNLGQFAEALTELSKAQNMALHPIEKHVTAYWIARTHEAAGDWDKAVPFYQAVASDSIPSWMRKKAAEALGQ